MTARTPLLLAALTLGLLVAAGCRSEEPPTSARVADASDPSAQLARTAVKQFHEDLDEEHYDVLCQVAEEKAFDATTKLPCRDFLSFIRTRLGKVTGSVNTEAPVIVDRPDHTFLTELQYTTRFQYDDARERFDWRITKGKATLANYGIEAKSLAEDRSKAATGDVQP